MGNITDNRINLTLPDADIATINGNLEQILALLPQVGLTPAQLKSFRGMDVHNKVFVEQCLIALEDTGARIVPPYIKADALANDLRLFEQLDVLLLQVEQVKSSIVTAQRIVGKEAYDMALVVYDLYGNAADAGIANAGTYYQRMGERFEKNTGRKAQTSVKPK